MRSFLHQVLSCLIALSCVFSVAQAADGKLLGTGGVLSIEGNAGGGITPWAVIASYGEKGELGFGAATSLVATEDFRLKTAGVALGWDNRLEVSLARQRLELPSSIGRSSLSQNIVSAKLKLAGDLIYGDWPQISLGVQHKKSSDASTLRALNIDDAKDVDYFLSASRLYLAGPFGRSWLLNANLRNTSAQQTGLLGFSQSRSTQFEASAAALLNRYWVLGAEFRAKPNNLAGLREDDWKDVFLAWFPNKNVSLALAYVDLGSIAGSNDQRGYFFSLQGHF